ncbi:MAG: Nucleopolyhedrovirus protein [Acidobacteriota bacterium]|jgi:chromosome segregation ATPase|nr:Nucleopolyhedrovirus protein [Acidobacteriota bacterium]
MSEELTERFEGGTPFEIRVLRELANLSHRFDGLESRIDRLEARFDGLEVRLTSLEEKVDARLHETRPIWEAVLTRLERIEIKLDVFARDLLETRVDVGMLKRHLPAA